MAALGQYIQHISVIQGYQPGQGLFAGPAGDEPRDTPVEQFVVTTAFLRWRG